jgi:signal transduction histidine kinase
VGVTNQRFSSDSLDYRAILDAMGQGVLLFDANERWVLDNLAARSMLGANLALVRTEGWSALAALLDARRSEQADSVSAAEARDRSRNQTEPVRFSALFGGSYIPCWAATIYGVNGADYTMITLEQPDWTPLHELLGTFREEARMAINSTRGHAQLITQLVTKKTEGVTVDKLAKRVTGFSEIMAEHMFRLQLYMELLRRLEGLRTGELITAVRDGRKKIVLSTFMEDFLEDMPEDPLMDTFQAEDIRNRLTLQMADGLVVNATMQYMRTVLRDLLRNAAMYSPKESPITLRAKTIRNGKEVQIDIVDEGYGIRTKDIERVFAPFQRSTQPQVIGEFGYGLSLYCAKAEIEAMGGKLWFESEEGVGSTFSFKLPAWRG